MASKDKKETLSKGGEEERLRFLFVPFPSFSTIEHSLVWKKSIPTIFWWIHRIGGWNVFQTMQRWDWKASIGTRKEGSKRDDPYPEREKETDVRPSTKPFSGCLHSTDGCDENDPLLERCIWIVVTISCPHLPMHVLSFRCHDLDPSCTPSERSIASSRIATSNAWTPTPSFPSSASNAFQLRFDRLQGKATCMTGVERIHPSTNSFSFGSNRLTTNKGDDGEYGAARAI